MSRGGRPRTGGGPGRALGRRARALLLVALLGLSGASAPLLWGSSILSHRHDGGADGRASAIDTDGTDASGPAGMLSALARAAAADGPLAGAPPGTDDILRRVLPSVDDIPLPPEPTGDHPLEDALAAWAAERGLPATPADDLAARVAALGMAEPTQRAVARLLAGVREARALQGEAVAGASDEDLALLSLQPDAVTAWFAAHPGAHEADFEEELAARVAHVDVGKNLQAAWMLARLVEAERPRLLLPPTAPLPADRALWSVGPDPWSDVEALVQAALPGPTAVPPLPHLSLPDALRSLATAAGLPDPGAGAVTIPPTLPPGVARALADLAVAHAFALRSGDPVEGATAILQAARAAQAPLRSLAAFRAAAALANAPQLDAAGRDWFAGLLASGDAAPAGPLPALPGGLDGLVPGLGFAAAGPAPGLGGLVSDADGDGSPDAAETALGTDPADPASRPVGGATLPAFPPGEDDLLWLPRPGAAPGEPALLAIGDVSGTTVSRRALLRVDLGGDDSYDVAVGTTTDLLVELAGDDQYVTPGVSGTQGSSQGLGAAILLDVSGNDQYVADTRSQGSACCGKGSDAPADVPLPSDLASAWAAVDAAAARGRVMAGGLGLLADLNGTDSYQAGGQSQGYGNNLAATALESDSVLVTGTSEEAGRGFAGILFDARGNDRYRFDTQGFGEVLPLTTLVTASHDGGRPVGLFADLMGDDRYDGPSSDPAHMPQNAQHAEGLFASQGIASVADGASRPATPSPVGAFLDLGGNDTYLLPSRDGPVVDASDAKNDQERTPETAGAAAGQKAPVRLFADVEPTNLQDSILDPDQDHAPTAVEILAGTDPGNGTDTPGGLFGEDPTDPEQTLLRAPHILGKAVPGAPVLLPGLAIGGTGDDDWTEHFDFFLDLGGNDTYSSQGPGDPLALPGNAGSLRLPRATLAVDLGGNDTYTSVISNDVPTPALDQRIVAYTAAPSMGGAHLGVAVLADLGGRNTFDARVSGHATHAPPVLGEDYPATAVTWGAAQGAGLLGGVGVLLADGDGNAFNASAAAGAEDQDQKPEVEAVAYGLAQGAGFLGGIGVLASLGPDSDDTYEAHAAATAPASPFFSHSAALGVAQGAGLGGIGILVDAGGDNAFAAPQGFAQGLGWGVANRTGTTGAVVGGGGQQGRPLEPSSPETAHADAALGLGALVSGLGRDAFEAAGPAQGAGGAFQSLQQGLQTSYNPNNPAAPTDAAWLQGGAGAGLLLDRGGPGAFSLGPGNPAFGDGSGAVALGQGAALSDSVGMLLALDGDDTYAAQGMWAQGAAVGGTGILLDGGGQDGYSAAAQSQGFGQSALAGFASEKACILLQSLPPYPCSVTFLLTDAGRKISRGDQVLFDAMPQGSTVGALLDLDGIDHYGADAQAQGYATDRADAALAAGFCRDPSDPGSGVHLGQDNLSSCPIPPGKTPGEDITMPTRDQFVATHRLGPPARGPLLAALVDAEGDDVYAYGQQGSKVPLGAATGPNDWQWRQQDLVPMDDLNETGLPPNPFQGPPDDPLPPVPGWPSKLPVSKPLLPRVVPAPVQPARDQANDTMNAVWPTVDGVVQSWPSDGPGGGPDGGGSSPLGGVVQLWPSSLPSAAMPAPPSFGGGIDASTLGAALAQLHDAGVDPIAVTLDLTHDEAGDDALDPGETATGTVYAQVAVAEPTDGAVPVRGVDLASDHGLIGALTALDATHFRLAWNTSAAGPDGPLTPDGAYRLRAVATVGAEGAPGRGVESPAKAVAVDNPPLLGLALGAAEVSGRTAAPAPEPVTIHLDVGPDAAAPADHPTSRPGGVLEVVLRSANGDVVRTLLPPTYEEAGPLDLSFNGRCGASACPDGADTVVARLTDLARSQVTESAPLRLDSHAPRSQVLLGGFTGADHRSGIDDLVVTWSLSDDGAPDLAGSATDLLRLEPDGSATVLAAGRGPGQREVLVGPVQTGERLRLLTVATDRLGNRESPCVGAEAEPCRQAALGQAVDVTIDFSPPRIDAATAQPTIVGPGEALTLQADVTEEGSGLSAVTAQVTDEGLTRTLASVPGVAGRFQATGALASRLGTGERLLSVQFAALDRAGNHDERSATVLLDGLAPRVPATAVRYYSQAGSGTSFDESSRLQVGRSLAFAALDATVEDAALDADLVLADPAVGVFVDPAPLNETLAAEGALPAFRLQADPISGHWLGALPIPPHTPDGIYRLPLRARDAAGNENLTTIDVAVDGRPPALGELKVLQAGYDHVDVSWTSAEPATGQAFYGRAASALNRATGLDEEPALVHTARIDGLLPRTQYFVQGSSVGGNGVENRTAAVAARTGSAVALQWTGLQPGAIYGGRVPVHVRARMLTGDDDPIGLSVSAQSENASLRPVPVAELPALPDPERDLTLDLRTLPDGNYTFLLDGVAAGDANRLVAGPVRIDHSAPFLVPLAPRPGAWVGSAKPGLVVLVGDPGDDGRDWASVATLDVDGKAAPANATAAPSAAAGAGLEAGEAALVVVPRDALPDGLRLVRVNVTDAAGNPASVAWPVRVDTAAPRTDGAVRIQGPEGAPQAAPGQAVRVAARLNDTGGVAAAWVLSPAFGAQRQPLSLSNGTWSATLPVAAGAAAGPAPVRIVATDRADNTATLDAGTLLVDRDAPRLGFLKATMGATDAAVAYDANEPVRLEGRVEQAGHPAVPFPAAGSAQQGTVRVTGLLPGLPARIVVRAVDLAGLAQETVVETQTLPDTAAPGAPPALNATSREEGRVLLSWAAAADDTGIAAYEARAGNGTWTRSTDTANRTLALDAPAGRTALVQVRAVDLAGKEGPAAEAEVAVLALPHLGTPALSKAVAREGQGVKVTVDYWDAAGRTPDIRLLLANGTVPLAWQSGDCRERCTYGATLRLAATSLFDGSPTFRVRAEVDGLVNETAPQPAPYVTAGGSDGLMDRLSPPPALVAPAALGLALAFAALRRRWAR